MRQSLFLLLQLSRRDIATRYRGSLLGRLWALLAPLLLLAVYTFVFSVVFQARWGSIDQGRTHFALNLFAGLILHGFLSESISRSTGILQQHGTYIKRVVFPLRLLVLMVVNSALFHAFISILILVLAVLLIQGGLHWQLLLLPVLIAPLVVFTLGVSLLLAALGLFIRDLGQLMPMLITVLLFTAPVFYPVSALPDAYQGWLALNPLTSPIEMLRGLLFTGQWPTLSLQLQAWVGAVMALIVGNFFFQRLRRGFADAL